MENESLENLKSFLVEDLYLVPEDLKKLERELQFFTNPDLNPINLDKSEHSISQVSGLQNTELSGLKPVIQLEQIAVKGDFTKGILILHEESELSHEILDMLVKMINACGHSMADVGLVSSEILENRTMDDFMALNSHVVLKFGRIKHPINGLPSQVYEVFTEGETEYLFADSLTVIAEDKNLKRKLWNCLQKLFNLSTT